MNALSWFLYAADVLSKIGMMFGGIGALSLILGVIFVIPGYMVVWTAYSYSDKDQINKSKAAFAWLAPRMIASGFILLMISMTIPAKQTMYMIAASEMGEMVVQTEQAQEVFSELKDTVIHQLRSVRGVKGE